jgi:hypothetical protein
LGLDGAFSGLAVCLMVCSPGKKILAPILEAQNEYKAVSSHRLAFGQQFNWVIFFFQKW